MLEYLESEANEYTDILLNKPSGFIGRRYLKTRGITKETAGYWGLGYCPVGYQPQVYKELNNNTYLKTQTKMHGRVTIPIRDQHGNLVSISGRLTMNSDKPKYDMYSSGNTFNARRVLFGLYQNKDTIRELDRAIITEGQMDVIMAWQKGVRFVTSSFGAHCSLDHLALLARYTRLVDLVYDADNAGKKGLENFQKISTLGDLEVRLKNPFSQGDDLDSWLRKHDAEALLNLLDTTPIDLLKNKLKIMGRGRG